MIRGIGTDIVDIRRIEKALQRFGARFEIRIFTASEREEARTIKHRQKRLAYYAKRFAAKEACAKALGTGIGKRLRFTDMEVTKGPAGTPLLTVKGKEGAILKKRAKQGLHTSILLSLSDEYPYALAFVMVADDSNAIFPNL